MGFFANIHVCFRHTGSSSTLAFYTTNTTIYILLEFGFSVTETETLKLRSNEC